MELSGGNTVALDYNFGEVPFDDSRSVISGRVYIDLNQNGQDDNEPGLRAVEVRLNGPVERTVLTNVNGVFTFEALPEGTYSLLEVQPVTYDDGAETLGSLGGEILPDGFRGIIVDGRNSATGYNFAEWLRETPSRNSIGGLVYLDINNNGRHDAPELVLPNVQITLTGPVTSTTVTTADGTYAFTGLPDGVYTITQTQPLDFLDGIDSIGTPASGIAGNDRLENIVLENNTVAINYNFGERGLLNPTKQDFLASTPPPEVTIQRLMGGLSPAAVFVGLSEDLRMHNPHLPHDVSYDGELTPLDALQVINHLNRATRAARLGEFALQTKIQFYADINDDGLISPLDALLVINELNRQSRAQFPQGESVSVQPLEHNLTPAAPLQSPLIAAPHSDKRQEEAVDELFAVDESLGSQDLLHTATQHAENHRPGMAAQTVDNVLREAFEEEQEPIIDRSISLLRDDESEQIGNQL